MPYIPLAVLLPAFLTVGLVSEVEIDPPADALLLQAARNAALAGDEPSAIERFQQYMSVRPEDGQAALELAGLLRRAERVSESLDVCRTALEHVRGEHEAHPERPEPLLQLARLHRWLYEYAAADVWYTKYLVLVPDDCEARLEHARLAGWDLRYTDALQHYETLERMFPDDEAIACEHEAKRLNWNDRPQKATRQYERALALKPEDPELLFDLAQMHSRRGFSQRAETLYDRLLTLMPDHSMAAQAKRAEHWQHRPRVTVQQWFSDREGRDGSVDITQFRTDVQLSPQRRIEACDLSLGVGQSFFVFEHNAPIDTTPSTIENVLNTFGFSQSAQVVRTIKQLPDRRRRQRFDSHSPATHLTMSGDKRFYSGFRLQGELELTAYGQHPHDTIQFDTEASYRIEDEWELGLGGGLEDVLENYATVDDGLSRYYLATRIGWDPTTWLHVDGRARYYFYEDGNRAIDYRIGPDITLLPYPRILELRSHFQGLHFAAEKPDYWTPREYWNVQTGLAWRHYLGDWHFEGAEKFCYYLEAYAGFDDSMEPQAYGTVGLQWDSQHKWRFAIEASATQSDVYTDRRFLISISRAW